MREGICAFRGWGVLLVACTAGATVLLPMLACADNAGVAPYQEFYKHIKSAQQVTPLGDSTFGDSIDLYTGATTFGATDATLPGNSTLPVQVRRRLVVEDRTFDPGNLGGFGDWDLDVPWIEGTFMAEDGWQVQAPTGGGPSPDRCSVQLPPYTYSSIAGTIVTYWKVWNGDQLHIPGAGSQELLINDEAKSPAYPSRADFPWVTKGNFKIGCLPSIDNGSGQGFFALSPDGVKYTFDHMVVHAAPDLKLPWTGAVNGYKYFPRSHVYLVATEVQDRFGNWVKYAWNGDHLTGITSSDGRTIALNWSGSTIASVTSEGGTPAAQTWQYGYTTVSGHSANGTVEALPVLTSVSRPDGSSWTYSYGGPMVLSQPGPDDIPPDQWGCQPLRGVSGSGAFDYTVGAPSGAKATFQFGYLEHYRSYVPKSCLRLESPSSPGPNADYPQVYNFFDNFTIQSKQVSGPGIPTSTWTYDYSELQTNDGYYVPSVPYDGDSATQPYIPPGTCSSCAASQTLKVVGPTSITEYTFGVQYARNEGRLLETRIEDLSGNVLKSTSDTYVGDSQAAGETFPDVAGQSLLPNFTSPMGSRIRPVTQTSIAQDGATFTTSSDNFDAFARATSGSASSSLGDERTDSTIYVDDTARWVLGMITDSAIDGTVVAHTDYDNLDQPTTRFSFGRLVSTNTWNADGTLASVTDGDNNTTALGGWYRGLPTTVTYADGSSESASVNAAGWITSVTDENGFTTNYAYDSMGRLTSISYPAGDDVAWNPTQLSFTQVSDSELGIPGGHWKQVVHTGDDYTVNYYDAYWRPLVTEHYDAGSVNSTMSAVVQRYDAGGRKVFMSYPTSGVTGYTQSLSGTSSSFDALNRVTEVDQSSSLGPLPTTTQYLTDFRTKVTDPNGHATITAYQAFGEPTTKYPVSVTAPEGEVTTIHRDVFGKPQWVKRSGSAPGSQSLTRYYVYNAHQQLCKRIEPESGATAFGYDGAGNLAWSASGLPLPDPGSCDASTAADSGRVVTRSYDARNRVTSVSYPDGFSNTAIGYDADGNVLSQSVANGGFPVTTTYVYDKRGLLTSETQSLPSTTPFTLRYGYDANGHLASVEYPDDRTVAYAPNALGQPTQAGSYASAVKYYPNGAIASFTYGSGAVHTMTETTRGLVGRSADSLNGTAEMDFGYNYDGDGNVAAITDYLPQSVGNVDMTYDGLDRLTEADSPMFGGSGKATYTYDVFNNLISADVGSHGNYDYTYNANNQLTALTDPTSGTVAVQYAYDFQGNLASKNSQVYQFDMANRLKVVPGLATYRYDAAGRRVQKVETSLGKTLDSDYSRGGQLMYQWNPANVDSTDYIYLGTTLVARVVGNQSQVTGSIDGVQSDSPPVVLGWACSTGIAAPISVELFAGGPSGGGGTLIATVTADQPSEPAIASACHTNGSTYRFSIPLSDAIRAQYAGDTLYMDGESPVGNGDNPLAGSGQYTVPAPDAPPAPASVTVPTSSSTGNVSVSWTAVNGATSYLLQQQFNGGSWIQAYSGTATSTALSGLDNGNYVYEVQACNAGGCSNPSRSSTLTVALIPAPPAGITAPASSYSPAIGLSWEASAHASNYVLEQRSNGGSWGVAWNGNATSTSVTVGASGTYQFQVSACGAGGCSDFTSSGNVAVTLPPVGAPSLSGPTSSASGTFTLNWTSVAGATAYKLNQNLGGTVTSPYDAAGTTWSSSNLDNGTYLYQAFACNVAGCGPGSNVLTVTILHVPDAPASAGAPALAHVGTAFNVNWSAVDGATSYQAQQTDTATGATALIYNGGTATSAPVQPTATGTYQYAARACNSAGCSAWTAVTHTTTVEGSAGGKPLAQPAPGSSS